ncbi:MAG: accessory factor UbiK family protein [Salinarimonadaceae bacterium]|nr:MAG: accessory factor UbiK family protein [Salinarimonadaceae bacterium]
MAHSSNRILDDLSRLFADAAGAASGARREVETIFRAQAEKFLKEMDVVTREEFEAMRDIATTARDENERLARRVDALEARLVKFMSRPE